MYSLGIAFRTNSKVIGYLPFYDSKDTNMDGSVSLFEGAIKFIPVIGNLGNPHDYLVKATAGNVEFIDDNWEIYRQLRRDLLARALRVSKGVFVDAILMSLGGPGLNKAVGAFVKSPTLSFVVSQAIEYELGRQIKQQNKVDLIEVLKN